MALVELPVYLEMLTIPVSERAQEAFEAAAGRRKQALELYRQRVDSLDLLNAQVTAGLWLSPDVAALHRAAHRDVLLLSVDAAHTIQDFAQLHDGEHDLDITFPFLARGLSNRLSENDFAQVLAFLKEGATVAGGTDPWTEALRLEGSAHLLKLWADWYLEQALAALEIVATELHDTAVGLDPYDPAGLEAQIARILLYYDYGLPSQVEEAFGRFRAAYREDGDWRYPWKDRLRTDPELSDDMPERFGYLLSVLVPVMELRNPSDQSEIDYLAEQAAGAKVLLPDLPSAPPYQFPTASAGLRRRARQALDPILEELAEPAGRPGQVLRAWAAVLDASLFSFGRVTEAADELLPDDEALGIVTHAILGEAQYRLADYEDAHRNLEAADRLAEVILARASAATAAERAGAGGFLGRVRQRDGNALFFMGEYELAREAYQRAHALAGNSPLDRATYLLNLGNLAYLRNNLVDQRGYVTLDWSEMFGLAEEGPRALQARKIGDNIASLVEAEGHYQACLESLQEVAADAPLKGELVTTVHINLGNTAWAWARVMEAEAVEHLDKLPVDGDWSSGLVSRGASRADCYRASIAQQHKALAAAAGDQASAATAWSNLAELYYLLAEQTQWDGASLEKGLEAAERVQALVGDELPGSNAEVLAREGLYLPEAVWRTAHNLARLHEALGNRQAAARHYEQALQALEAMRRMIRLDTWQATFLQDKLDVYEDYVHFLYHDDAGAHAARLFQLLEMTKARAFLDLVEGAGLQVGSGAGLQARQTALLAAISACNERIRQAIAGDKQDEAHALAEEQQARARAWKDLESEILAAREGDRDLDPPLGSLSQFQAFLREQNAVLLSFLLGRRYSYLLVVDAGAVHAYELAGRREIELTATRLLWYCQQNSTHTFAPFRNANEHLVRLLLGAAGAELDLKAVIAQKRVAIAPDGVLFYLPFEVLLIDPGHRQVAETAGYAGVRPFYWLAQQGAGPSYVPSASAWQYLADRHVAPSQTSLLGVYNVNYDMGSLEPMQWAMSILKSLRNLPGAERVGRILQQFADAWPQRSVVPVRAWRDDQEPEQADHQSTEDNFVRLVTAQKPQIVLFSGHAVYNDKYPSLSGLIFNLAPVTRGSAVQEGSVGHQDGFLNVKEIFRLQMPQTELAFLAACQSGLGVVYRGEGINALTRALMYRGCPAVIVSLWAVSDRSTGFLTRRFFELLLENPDADRADLLAEAKRQVLQQSAPYFLPFYWAPFVLNGVRIPSKE